MEHNPAAPTEPTRPSVQDGSEIELLKDRLAKLERRLDESKNEIWAKLEMLQRTIHQRAEHLPENESHANIQFRVGCCKNIVSNHDNTYGFAIYGLSSKSNTWSLDLRCCSRS